MSGSGTSCGPRRALHALPTADLLSKIADDHALARYEKAQPRMLESIVMRTEPLAASAVVDLCHCEEAADDPKRTEALAEARDSSLAHEFSGTSWCSRPRYRTTYVADGIARSLCVRACTAK